MNAEITDFLAHSAIPFAQKNMAITHFVFDEDSFALLGFYTLTTKAIEIKRRRDVIITNRHDSCLDDVGAKV